jgi:HlyD family secretion protein
LRIYAPLIYSESNCGKLVFLAEARPPKTQAALLNPGQPVTVMPAACPP